MQVTQYNVGHWCLSEDECIAEGINFAAYERGVADAAKAFRQNAAPTAQSADALDAARKALTKLDSLRGPFPPSDADVAVVWRMVDAAIARIDAAMSGEEKL